jgi:hypothetical protein
MVILIFLTHLEILETDIMYMSIEQIKSKLYEDFILDNQNWIHTVPLLFLCCEYLITNIPFSFNHFVLISLLNMLYLCFQAFYTLNYGIVYKYADWNNNMLGCTFIG